MLKFCVVCNFYKPREFEYSKEGLCYECELHIYINRFYPCPGCRNPTRYQGWCVECNFIPFRAGKEIVLPAEIFFAVLEWKDRVASMTYAGTWMFNYEKTCQGFFMGKYLWKIKLYSDHGAKWDCH